MIKKRRKRRLILNYFLKISVAASLMMAFVDTDETSSFRFGYCRPQPLFNSPDNNIDLDCWFRLILLYNMNRFFLLMGEPHTTALTVSANLTNLFVNVCRVEQFFLLSFCSLTEIDI